MHRFASALGTVAVVSIASFASAPALADCPPGPGLCASAGAQVALPVIPVQVGGQITIGIPPLFQPAAPPAAPQPQVIVVPGYERPQAPPPPPYGYGYQPAPQRPVYAYAPPEPFWGASRLGLDLRVDGAAGFGGNKLNNAYGMGGAGLGFRYRASPHLGFEAGLDVLAGRDYNDNKRTEVGGSLGALLFFNPRSRAQVYLSGGVLADHAHASNDQPTPDYTTISGGQSSSLTYNHVGGYAGLGLEMFATRRLSFHLDAKGIVRQAVGGDTPEFTDANGRTTNTSGGLVGQAGMVFYF